MIEYISGRFTDKNPAFILVEANGIGYYVHVSLNTSSDLASKTEGKMLIHYAINVDIRSGESRHQLYGFSTGLERQIFRQLVAISGISSTIAMMVLSSFKPSEVQSIILTGDSQTLTSVKGIGPKVAQKIVGELRGKISTDDHSAESTSRTGNSLRQEALSALTALGFDRASTVKAINTLLDAEDAPESVEQLVKRALKQL